MLTYVFHVVHLFLIAGSVPDAGLCAFMRRAVGKATDKYARVTFNECCPPLSAPSYARRVAKGLAESLPAQSGVSAQAKTGESVGDLLRAVRQEEAKVHIELTSALKARRL